MIEARLKARIIVQSAIRQAGLRGTPATVVRRGDPDAGQVYVKINRGFDDGCSILAPQRDYESGRLTWRLATGETPVSETEADAFVERERAIDPDLWLIEIEDRDGWHPFDEPL